MKPQALSGTEDVKPAGWMRIGMPERPLWRDALHILAVFNVLIAHPLLERAGQNVWFFVAERASSWEIIGFALVLCLVLPGLLAGMEGLAELIDPRLRNGLHAFLMTAVLAIGGYLILLVREGGALDEAVFSSSSLGPAVMALLAAAAASLLYFRFEAAQFFVTVLVVGVLIVPGNFLMRSGASKLVFPPSSSSEVVSGASAETPVVMVVFDELPLVSLLDEDYRIDSERYPGFASLADDSHWFRNATGVSDASNYAVPAMLSGVYPEIGKVPTNHDYPRNLFTMLGDSYEMNVVEPVSSLCPDDLCGDTRSSSRDRVALWRGAITEPDIPLPILSPERPDVLSSYTESIDRSDRPTLHFFHSMLPHSPWVYLPSGKTYTEDLVPIGLQADHTWAEDDWLTTQNYQRHLLQVQYTDKLLGDLLNRLRSTGIYDNALIVVTADHGINFQPGEHSRFISEENVEYITPVPLLIKQPNQTDGVIHNREVELIDIVPTIADVLKIDLDWELEGRSLFDDSRPEETERKVFDYSTGSQQVLDPDMGQIEAAVDEKVRLFGSGQDGLFRVGEYPDLVGQETDQLPISGTSQMELTIDDEARYEDIDLEDEFVPALITGDVRPNGEEQPSHLAVAVNGTVRAITRTYFVYDDVKFAAVVPEESFRQGQNEIDVMAISGPPDSPEIRTIDR